MKGERFTGHGLQPDMEKMGTDFSKYSPLLDLFSAVSIAGVGWCKGNESGLI